ncbi:DUF4145 domain-containing protein [Candidatus Methylomirabilis limnetica]|jgi:ribosomal protein L20A (L18A)|uniref:DUF4145 domain-containing protein n=1 Tax=Candidatus Methylomirabilis limnetica TaxID=2033718 RepID=UPI001EFE6218|nr:DUF4145 domain-containing protein [Candidatus Methylomirabilis limnetica]
MQQGDVTARRFTELERQMARVQPSGNSPSGEWYEWATSVLNLLQRAFGAESAHLQNFQRVYNNFTGWGSDVEAAKGVFRAAKTDYDGGYIFNLETAISGEIFGDFVGLAKRSLAEGHKDVAAVLACAALEDVLKRFAARHRIDTADRSMQDVVNALKAKGLVGGAQKTLLGTMPKIRDYAMHAEWTKIDPADVSSVIGFVEQFLISHFS